MVQHASCPGASIMAFDRRRLGQIIWGLLLIAMGVVLCVTEPYALRMSPDSPFLNFARYFIAVLLIGGGAIKLYKSYFSKDKEPHSDR